MLIKIATNQYFQELKARYEKSIHVLKTLQLMFKSQIYIQSVQLVAIYLIFLLTDKYEVLHTIC